MVSFIRSFEEFGSGETGDEMFENYAGKEADMC